MAADTAWWRGDIFYEVFVRSFADSDGDGIGDLPGLTARLDYLNDGDPDTKTDLGVDALWLMPIYPSPSYHGYDVVDYRAVNPDYGTLADLDALLAAAHARGMKVILDFVLNHSSSQHPWFQSARRGKDAPFRDYYTWRDAPDPSWQRPWDGAGVWHESGDESFYALFWSGMPDVNLAHAPARAEMVEAMGFWLDRGVDGFRIDAARYLVEETPAGAAPILADSESSHRFIRELRAEFSATHPEALFVAEAWSSSADISTYFGAGDEYQLAFSFDVAGALVGSSRDGERAHLKQALTTAAEVFTDRSFEAPFLTNHDMTRVMRQLGGDAAKAHVAAAALLAMPGTPFLYYGEEIGMRGGDGGADENKRTPMRWTEEGGFSTARPWFAGDEAAGVSVAAQSDDADSLLSTYRRLITLRHASPALGTGDATVLATSGGGRGAFALLRETDDERVLFIANFDAEPAAALRVHVDGEPEVVLSHAFDGAITRNAEGLFVSALGPHSFAFARLAAQEATEEQAPERSDSD